MAVYLNKIPDDSLESIAEFSPGRGLRGIGDAIHALGNIIVTSNSCTFTLMVVSDSVYIGIYSDSKIGVPQGPFADLVYVYASSVFGWTPTSVIAKTFVVSNEVEMTNDFPGSRMHAFLRIETPHELPRAVLANSAEAITRYMDTVKNIMRGAWNAAFLPCFSLLCPMEPVKIAFDVYGASSSFSLTLLPWSAAMLFPTKDGEEAKIYRITSPSTFAVSNAFDDGLDIGKSVIVRDFGGVTVEMSFEGAGSGGIKLWAPYIRTNSLTQLASPTRLINRGAGAKTGKTNLFRQAVSV